MPLITAFTALRSRFAIMPMPMHIAFCAVATVIFGLIFIRKKTVSSLIWMLICDTTAVLQFYSDRKTATAVAISEVFLFCLLAVVSFREKKAEKARAMKEEQEAKEHSLGFPEDMQDLDKLIKSETHNLSDSSDDVIKNAFEEDNK